MKEKGVVTGLTRVDKGRTHYYCFEDGKPLIGNTTIISKSADKSGLIGWAANSVVKYIEEKCTTRNGAYIVSSEDLKEAGKAHNKFKDATADLGTQVHAEVEEFINRAMSKNHGFMDEKWLLEDTKFIQTKHFIGWALSENFEFWASERIVGSRVHHTAGTLDFSGYSHKKEKHCMGDVKTSSGVYDRGYFAQCGGYAFMGEEMGDDPYEAICIVRLDRSGVFNAQKDVHWSFNVAFEKEGWLAKVSNFKYEASFNK